MFTLPKSERLHGKSKISALMSRGRWGFTSGGLKYCFLKDDETSHTGAKRLKGSGESGPQCSQGQSQSDCGTNNTIWSRPNSIIVSVPKRLFKRAVKRNLLKRRLREAYRTQKDILPPKGYSILFLYNTKEVLEYSALREQVGAVLQKLAEHEA